MGATASPDCRQHSHQAYFGRCGAHSLLAEASRWLQSKDTDQDGGVPATVMTCCSCGGRYLSTSAGGGRKERVKGGDRRGPDLDRPQRCHVPSTVWPTSQHAPWTAWRCSTP